MKIIIIHGWDAKPDQHWYPWLSRELSNKGFEVLVPEMPDTSTPVIEAWVSTLGKLVEENKNEDLILVGHSIGTQTIMRFLAESDIKVKGIVLVGAWITLNNELLEEEGEEVQHIAEPWLMQSIYFANVISSAPVRTVILSEDDYYVPYEENKKLFEEKLQAEVITEYNKGHFTSDDNIIELPSAINAVLEITKS